MMRKVLPLLLLAILLTMAACGKEGFENNENIGKILGVGAAGRGAGNDSNGYISNPATREPASPVDSMPNEPPPGDGRTYYKLLNGSPLHVDAGTYTVAQADNVCTISVIDASDVTTETVTLADSMTAPKGVITAARLEVPEGGELLCTVGNCVAELN